MHLLTRQALEKDQILVYVAAIGQIVFLPLYLWLFLGETFAVNEARQEMTKSFLHRSAP
jgi:hypothetical protein